MITLTRTWTGAGHLMINEAGPVNESGCLRRSGFLMRAYVYPGVDRTAFGWGYGTNIWADVSLCMNIRRMGGAEDSVIL